METEKVCTFAAANGISRWHLADSLAQLVEHRTFNAGVSGSSPERVTEGEGGLLQSSLSLFL